MAGLFGTLSSVLNVLSGGLLDLAIAGYKRPSTQVSKFFSDEKEGGEKLPVLKYFSIKPLDNKHYLCSKPHDDAQGNGLVLQFCGEEIVSPYTKFEAEMSEQHPGLVHIRCCYNNKYWVRQSPEQYQILAAASEPEENTSKPLCTLFKFEAVDCDGSSGVRFTHVQLGLNVRWRRADQSPFEHCLYADSEGIDHFSVYKIFEWGTIFVMPRYVAFLGDNGRYLSSCLIDGRNHLKFESAEKDDPTVWHETSYTPDGCLRLKSVYFDKFWRRRRSKILVDSEDSAGKDAHTIFRSINVDSSILLISSSNFGLSRRGKDNYLRNSTPPITNTEAFKEAVIKVKELVVSRQIFNVNFCLKDARIYHKKLLLLLRREFVNETNEAYIEELNLPREDVFHQSSAWNSVVTWKSLDVKASIQTGIPHIKETVKTLKSSGPETTRGEIHTSQNKDDDQPEIEILGDFSGEYKWGDTISPPPIVSETVYRVTVPGMSRVLVEVHAREASYDIPFSYNQCDTFTGGAQITYHMEDGLYTGSDRYDVQFQVSKHPVVQPDEIEVASDSHSNNIGLNMSF
ncbi:hypothetical protein Tsubulata_008108 [Turnera subulata]|uniref:Agglutinin domain-containing protein n=1 Tax=Turnera subulata TaxID=218843 RepID=A0A9Q0G4W3_9ROSI|nr:hypothetical protein Tsubulata_008108 [Turnera subulata]